LSINRAAQHQSAATHVAATDEVSGEAQPVTKVREQNINIFSRGNAAEQNDFAPGRYFFCQTPCVALERCSITRIIFVNVDHSEFPQVIEANSLARIDQAAGWRDDKHPRGSSDRARKCICVGNFPAKIEAAQKSKHLSDCRASFAAQSFREIELRSLAQNHARPLTGSVRG
jgi:hypothetical protein